ncbi:MAG: hypothetical protein K8I30_18745, partial [Anaerolineae bacterium]|nr:hypothetical protein [Anaerolineae bacterium]
PIVPQWLAGYPPLYVWINMGVQRLVETFSTKLWILPPDYMYYLRLLNALIGITTTALIAFIGWQLGGWLAAWLAGFIWGLTPVIVQNNSIAVPDPFVYLTSAAVIAMSLRAWQRQSPAWSFGALLASIAAIYLKYPAVVTLIPWGAVTLGLTLRLRRKMLPWLLIQAFVAGVAAAYLIFGYGAFNLSNREANSVRRGGLTLAFDLDRNLNNWWFAIYPIGLTLFLLTTAAGAAVYIYNRRRGARVIDLPPLLVLLVYCIIGIMISAMFSRVNFPAGKVRHVFPLTAALVPMWAAGVAQVTWLAGRVRPRLLIVGALLVVGAFTLPGFISGNLELIHNYSLPEARYVLWRWSDENIPNDGLILMHAESYVEKTWNRNYSGYDGFKPFAWWYEDKPWQSTPQQLAERGITYFAMALRDRRQVYSNPERLDEFLAQLVPVKTFPASDGMYGLAMAVYRILPPQVAADAVFGGQIELVGYDLDKSELMPGDSLTLRPYWHAVRTPDTNYSLFVHLYPADEDRLIAQYDGAPTTPQRLTLTWTDPDELYIGLDIT